MELGALELASQREIGECASETEAAKAEQLARTLSLSRHAESTALSEIDPLRKKLEKLRAELLAVEDDRANLQKRVGELEAIGTVSAGSLDAVRVPAYRFRCCNSHVVAAAVAAATATWMPQPRDTATRILQLESAVELERCPHHPTYCV